jgi:hypothetical protein
LIEMKSHVTHIIVLAAAVSVGACRQADGPIPTPNESTQNEIGDISRDLQAVAARDSQAPLDLAHDLRKYSDRSSVQPAIDELSSRTARVIAGSKLTAQTADRLAHNLWIAVAARKMSQRQVEALQNDLHALLVSAGVAEERAEPVAAQVEEVQRLVTTRPKRWYEFF